MTAAAPPGRDPGVDALRGFALLGVVLVNTPFFAAPILTGPPAATLADGAALALMAVLAEGKFFLIFSFLFGFGFAVSIDRDRASGRASGPRLLRRLAGLFAFGILHAVFLFVGDILMLYAALGLVLWACRGASARTLLISGGIAYAVAVVAQTLWLATPSADMDELAQTAAAARAAYLGSFLDAAAFRWSEDLWTGLSVVLPFNGPAALAMFLCGSGLARAGLFPGGAEDRRRPRLAAGAFLVGLASSLAGVPLLDVESGVETWSGIDLAGGLLLALGAPPLALAYGLTVLRAAERHPEAWPVRLLGAVGRMSLSGYLLHSVILSFVFGGWGLGQYGSIAAVGSLAIGAATYGAIVVGATLWQRWFRYGADEWLLRSWVDLEWKPLLRRSRNP